MNIQMIHFMFCQHNREIGKDECKTNDFQRLFGLQKTFKFLLQDLSINVIIFKIYKQSHRFSAVILYSWNVGILKTSYQSLS